MRMFEGSGFELQSWRFGAPEFQCWMLELWASRFEIYERLEFKRLAVEGFGVPELHA